MDWGRILRELATASSLVQMGPETPEEWRQDAVYHLTLVRLLLSSPTPDIILGSKHRCFADRPA